MIKAALVDQVFFHHTIAFEIQGIINAIRYFVQGKCIGLNCKPGDFDRHFRSDSPTRGACRQDVDESGAAPQIPGLFKLADHVIGVADAGGGGIGDAVGG